MAFIDHLKNNNPERLILEVAFGVHLISGDLAKSMVAGSSPSHQITLQQVFGEAFGKGWKALKAAWFLGADVPLANIKFHPGKQTQLTRQTITSVNDTTDTFTLNAHGYNDGDQVFIRARGSSPSLPDGLVEGFPYLIANKTTNTFQLEEAGFGVVDITSAGSGTIEVWLNDPVQGVDLDFLTDVPHTNTAWARVRLPVGYGNADTTANPPTGLVVLAECQTGDVYDDTGDVTASDVLLTNPADVLAFLCRDVRGFADSRIDWISLDTLGTYFDSTETPDFTTLPEGVGLTGRFYSGTSFDTLVRRRVDPAINFPSTTVTPEFGLPETFSVRWEGKIKPKWGGSHTFWLQHNDGVKLWVDNTVVIDQWSSTGDATTTGNISLTAETFYDIKLEWKNVAGSSKCIMEWAAANQVRQVVPQDRLYPKDEAQKHYECNVVFTQTTTFENALAVVCQAANAGYQDVDGKLTFFSFDQLTTPSFDFDESNIKELTFKFYPRFNQQDLKNLPNRFVAVGRDLESRFYESFNPQVAHDVESLQAIAGRVIEEQVYVGNTNRWQARKVLALYAKVRTAQTVCEFEGMPNTLSVVQADLVTVTHPLADWADKEFLVLEATDKSIDAGADERIFKLLEWN